MQKITLLEKTILYEIGRRSSVDKYSLLTILAKEAFDIDIVIERKNNKPYVLHHLDLFCSVSDSHNLNFVGLCKGSRVGVDVEYIQARKNELLEYSCSKEEVSLVRELQQPITNIETVIWSLKESVQKSDVAISPPHEYIITSATTDTITIQKKENTWVSTFFEKDGYVFSFALQIR